MCRILCRAMIATLVALVALAAVAGEGRIPIYKWHNPITQPGKYIVTRDIVPLACAAPVIDIQIPAAFPSPAGYVDIDLNGFRVNACGGDPVIRAIGHDNITVRNGTLAFATHGIHIVGGPAGNRKVVIEDVKIMDVSSQGILLEGITDFAIRRGRFSPDRDSDRPGRRSVQGQGHDRGLSGRANGGRDRRSRRLECRNQEQ